MIALLMRANGNQLLSHQHFAKIKIREKRHDGKRRGNEVLPFCPFTNDKKHFRTVAKSKIIKPKSNLTIAV
jgi:hypothetical protein